MKYVNHLGREFDLESHGLYTHRKAIRDYEWDIRKLGGAVSSTGRREADLPIDVFFAMDDAGECRSAKDALSEILDTDANSGKLGKLYNGDWYVSCILKSSSKDIWWYEDIAARFSLVFYVPKTLWTRENSKQFWNSTSGGIDHLDYPHDYPYNYRLSLSNSTIDNPGYLPAPVKFTVYGPASHVRIVAAGNVYEIDTSLEQGDVLTIDGLSKTIVKKKPNGEAVNAFHLRRGVQRMGSGSYVFEPLPPGLSEIYWDGSFGFDAVAYEQRSESRW